MLKTHQPDQEWIERAREHTRGRGPRKHQKLKNKLLDIGGWAAVIPQVEEDLEKLMARGRKFPGRSRTMKGDPCQCHSNSAFCWDENRDLCSICTGYALSRDGVWRQHSWVYTNQGQLVETTEKRIQYFGYVMSLDECEEFLFRNSADRVIILDPWYGRTGHGVGLSVPKDIAEKFLVLGIP